MLAAPQWLTMHEDETHFVLAHSVCVCVCDTLGKSDLFQFHFCAVLLIAPAGSLLLCFVNKLCVWLSMTLHAGSAELLFQGLCAVSYTHLTLPTKLSV